MVKKTRRYKTFPKNFETSTLGIPFREFFRVQVPSLPINVDVSLDVTSKRRRKFKRNSGNTSKEYTNREFVDTEHPRNTLTRTRTHSKLQQGSHDNGTSVRENTLLDVLTKITVLPMEVLVLYDDV